MNALLTGSEGFIGKHFSKFLSDKNIKFHSMGSKNLDRTNHFKVPNLLDKEPIKEIIKSISPEIIFHLAGSPDIKNEKELFDVNVGFARTIIEALSDLNNFKTKLVLLGTAAEYGIVKEKDLPLNEEHIPKPISSYGQTKLMQTNFALQSNSEDCPVIVLRPFNIYGPWMPNYLSISNFANQINQIKNNKNSGIQSLKVGNLHVERDFIFIKDFITMLWDISSREEAYGEVYNACSGIPLSLLEIVEYMIDFSGTNLTIKQEKTRFRKDDMKIHYGDNSKILSIIPDINFTPWKKGIEGMLL